MKDHITVQGQDGKFAAYIARPETVPAPAVVVLQELFGVNADIRRHCDELAEQGYIALAPDLYWRQEPGVDLNVTSQADWDHGLRLYSAYDRDAGVRDIKDTIDAARSLPECNGKVALLGYCLGALMVFMTAVRNDGIDAAVWYHGADTDKYLGEVDGLHAPILMHVAEEDEFISKAAQAEIKAALAKKPNATVYSYPGQSHAFSRHNGAHYNAAAAHLANGRTSEFLQQTTAVTFEMTRKIEIERFSLTTSKPFDEVIAGVNAGIGHPDMAEFGRSTHEARSFAELKSAVEKGLSTVGLMLFMQLDHGAILRKETGRETPKMIRFVIGNPLIMKEMVKHVPDAGSYAPVTVLVDERADGVHLSYDRMASFLAPYGNRDALEVARNLDKKIEGLLRQAAA